MSTDQDFADFFALCQLYYNTIKSKEYLPNSEFVRNLTLAPYGVSIFNRMKEKHQYLEDVEILSSLVHEMYWSDLFFIPNNTNIRILELELSRALQSGSIRAPWVYGGLLYKKVGSFPKEIADELNPEETWSLLLDTPQGVFQYRKYVSGPLGLMKSKQMRDHKSQLSIPLSHCSDPSCAAIHPALLTDRWRESETTKILRAVLDSDQENSSELHKKYSKLDGESEYYDDRNAAGIIPFIGDSFDITELRLIIEDLLAQPNGMRSQLSKVPHEKSFSGSAAHVASRFDEAACLQAMLLESDSTIAASIDRLIIRNTIKIPASETRSAKLAMGSSRGWHSVTCEASCYGIRLKSLRPGVPLARLKRLVSAVYGADENNSGLGWTLRYTVGETIEQKLDNYTRDHTPREALAKHVFSSPEALEKAFDVIRYGHFQLPETDNEEDDLIKRMMWKLGFDVPSHPLHYQRLRETLENLREVNAKYPSRNGDSLHRIRGEAVNFFVELERFLGHALAFLCWMLTSDHYTRTRFSYDLGSSFREMAEKLNAYQEDTAARQRIGYDLNGKNSLFPLIGGFRLLADYCRQLETESTRHLKSQEEHPGYIGLDRIQVFPFNHNKFFLDLSENSRTTILSELAETTVTLERLNTANLRNRMEHNRDDFPDQEEIALLLEGLSILVERMQSTGFAPLSYTYSGRRVDRWGRREDDYENHRGQTIRLPARVELASCGVPTGQGYIIIVPSIRIGSTQELARFLIREPSRYQELWKGYPIKRFISRSEAFEGKMLSEVIDVL